MASNKREARSKEAADGVLDEVSRLDGFAPFHTYLGELGSMRKQLRSWDRPGLFPHRHLLISLNPGDGRTTLLTQLHAYLCHAGLFPNGRKAQSHAYRLIERNFPAPVSNVIPEDTPFTELEQDMRYQDMGVVGLAMDDWPGCMDAVPVRKLMAYCRENRSRFLFVFFVPVLEGAILERLTAQLSEHIPIRHLSFSPASDEDLTALAVRRLAAFGIGWSPSLNPLFRHRLIHERGDGRFHGRVTAMKLVTELLIARARNAIRPDATAPAWQAAEEDFEDTAPLWHPSADQTPLTGVERLNRLVGLQDVKTKLMDIITTMRISRGMGSENDMPATTRSCHHLLFTGGPGTGKTEVARLFGQILREEGLLPVGDLLETNRFDLVGQCIGQTGPRTMAVCQAAMGSVLFVDEAYLLAAHEDAGSSRDFGQEALGALIAEMENRRDRFIVILAGYREEMESLYHLNPGLRDRIPHIIHFPGYTRGELRQLFLSMSAKTGIPDEALGDRVSRYFDTLPDAFLTSKEFGHARFVRNLVERTGIKALMRRQDTSATQPLRLSVIDFEQAIAEEDLQTLNRERIRRPIGFSHRPIA